jgi:uncharacterized protein with GYD domain
MPTFVLPLSWTDQGIRKIRDTPKRNKAVKKLAEKIGIGLKQPVTTTSFSLSIPEWEQRCYIRAPKER